MLKPLTYHLDIPELKRLLSNYMEKDNRTELQQLTEALKKRIDAGILYLIFSRDGRHVPTSQTGIGDGQNEAVDDYLTKTQ